MGGRGNVRDKIRQVTRLYAAGAPGFQPWRPLGLSCPVAGTDEMVERKPEVI